MSEQMQSRDAIVARLERLEQQNRRLKRSAVVCLLVFTGVGLMAQTKKARTPAKPPAPAAAPAPAPPAPPPGPTIVEAEGFVLKDANGRVRAELSMAGTGPSLKLKDPAGTALVTLSLNDGTPGGPFLLLSDPQHHGSLSMSVLQPGGPQLSLTGDRPDIQMHFAVAPEGTTLELSDKDGFGTTIGNGVQASKNGKTKNDSAASIVLFGKDRKTLWSTP